MKPVVIPPQGSAAAALVNPAEASSGDGRCAPSLCRKTACHYCGRAPARGGHPGYGCERAAAGTLVGHTDSRAALDGTQPSARQSPPRFRAGSAITTRLPAPVQLRHPDRTGEDPRVQCLRAPAAHSALAEHVPRGGRPCRGLADAITEYFGSFEGFHDQLTAATVGVQGSGWGVLCWEPAGRRLIVEQVYDHHGNVAQGAVPLLAFDAWEHAYYL